MSYADLVSVVIPAYNADGTLDETLCSACAQTHRVLEIIVVDDGSTDSTGAIAARHAARDARVRVIHQRHCGLAAARNAGWQQARADLIAFLDADDLWAPTKIERQLEALHAGGERVGLVYCGSVRIDAEGLVTDRWPLPRCAGAVLEQIFAGNFVGNGSAALVRRQALIDVNGFETALRAADAQGCEDYLLQCRIAETYHFAVVPEHLVGYRDSPHNLSSDRPRMLRSWMLVVDEMLARHPGSRATLRSGLRHYSRWVVHDAMSWRGLGQLPALLRLVLRFPAPVAVRVLGKDLPLALAVKLRSRIGRLVRRRKRVGEVAAGTTFLPRQPVKRLSQTP